MNTQEVLARIHYDHKLENKLINFFWDEYFYLVGKTRANYLLRDEGEIPEEMVDYLVKYGDINGMVGEK